MSKTTAADVLAEVLIDWGVDTIFGLPGDGINGFMESLRIRQEQIRFIQARHEEAAAFMACGYAKYTGRLGVCMSTSGPGGIHLLNGLYDAKLDGQPVLAITGNQFHDLYDTYGQQDVRLERLFDDVALYNTRVMGPAHIENVAHMACRSAIYGRGVAHITFPADLQKLPVAKAHRSQRNRAHHVSANLTRAMPSPSDDAVAEAARVLNAGEKVAILAGRGAGTAREHLLAAAETLGAPIIKALLGKDVVPDDSPYTTGSIGLLGTLPSQEAMEECDTLLIVGSSFPYIEFYPKPGQARCVQIDTDPTRIGLRYPVDVGLVGGSAETLRRLLPLITEKADKGFLEKAQEGMADWREQMNERGTSADMPMKPQVVAHELNRLLTDDAIVACDSGTIATWWARHIDARGKQRHTLSGNLATMACGLPYAIAAQIAYPDRQCVAFVGDGGLSMLIAELATCVKYDLPVKVVVIKNDTLGQIKWEQMVVEGNPEYGCELQPIDFETIARGFGVAAFTADEPGSCGEVLRRAMQTPGPALVQAVVDPLTPPLPPKIKWDQAKHFAEALARGEPQPFETALTAAYDKVRQLI